jgi:hypothetical protein
VRRDGAAEDGAGKGRTGRDGRERAARAVGIATWIPNRRCAGEAGDRNAAGAGGARDGLTRVVRVFAYSGPVDLRKGFNGLSALVEQEMTHKLLGRRPRDLSEPLDGDNP